MKIYTKCVEIELIALIYSYKRGNLNMPIIVTKYHTFAFRMCKKLRRYKEPTRMPQIPGTTDLFHDDIRSCNHKPKLGMYPGR